MNSGKIGHCKEERGDLALRLLRAPVQGSAHLPRPISQLWFGTVSFTICFAAWGMISAFAPRFRELFHLTATQTRLLVAVPVLLGSLARIPTGMLTDRLGGRLMFSLLLLVVAVPAFLVPQIGSYRALLLVGFFLGLAGSSFAIGMGFVSRWFPPEQQGSALGVYGLGNIGQSVAVLLGPVLAAVVGWQNVFPGAAAQAQETTPAYQEVTKILGRSADYKDRVLKVNIPQRRRHDSGGPPTQTTCGGSRTHC